MSKSKTLYEGLKEKVIKKLKFSSGEKKSRNALLKKCELMEEELRKLSKKLGESSEHYEEDLKINARIQRCRWIMNKIDDNYPLKQLYEEYNKNLNILANNRQKSRGDDTAQKKELEEYYEKANAGHNQYDDDIESTAESATTSGNASDNSAEVSGEEQDNKPIENNSKAQSPLSIGEKEVLSESNIEQILAPKPVNKHKASSIRGCTLEPISCKYKEEYITPAESQKFKRCIIPQPRIDSITPFTQPLTNSNSVEEKSKRLKRKAKNENLKLSYDNGANVNSEKIQFADFKEKPKVMQAQKKRK